jgi:hypothetical protein
MDMAWELLNPLIRPGLHCWEHIHRQIAGRLGSAGGVRPRPCGRGGGPDLPPPLCRDFQRLAELVAAVATWRAAPAALSSHRRQVAVYEG